MATGTSGILLESGTNELEIIELYIQEEDYRGYYGVNVAKVLEIIIIPENIVKPPNAAPFVYGLFNHRGKVILLIDLAKWLGRSRIETDRPTVLITEFNKITTAFLVSGVTRIHRTSWSKIKPLDEFTQGFSSALTGVILLEDRTVFMLDLEKAIGDIDPKLAVPLQDKPSDANLDKAAQSQQGITDVTLPDVSGQANHWKALHADDSAMIRRATKDILEGTGEYVVTSLVDGDAAWNYLMDMKMAALDENRPITDFINIIFSDIEMPGMDGYSLCRKVKNDPDLKGLPVVLFSSLITDKLLHKGEAVGANRQLAKPSPNELIRTAKELLNVQAS